MPLARTWLWAALFILAFLIAVNAALVLASSLTPFQARPGNGFLADSFLGKANRQVTVIRPNRPVAAAEAMRVNTGWSRRTDAAIEALCIVLNERALWEPGNTTSTMSSHFMQGGSVVFFVDELQYTLDNGMVTGMVGHIPNSVFDGQNQIIGSYGVAEYCLDTTDLPDGVHHATMIASSVSGVEHEYEWYFEISDAAEAE